MEKAIIFREMRDPATGKVRLWAFHVKLRNRAELPQILAQIDAQYPRRERYDA